MFFTYLCLSLSLLLLGHEFLLRMTTNGFYDLVTVTLKDTVETLVNYCTTVFTGLTHFSVHTLTPSLHSSLSAHSIQNLFAVRV